MRSADSHRSGPSGLLTANGIPRVVSGALLVCLAVQLVGTVRELSSARSIEQPAQRQLLSDRAARRAASGGSRIGTIVAAHLFGVDAPAPQESGSPAQSSTTLALSGVLASESPSRGAAIVGSAASATKLVFAGQEIVPGVRLHDVYPDHIVLSRAGRLESLSLPHASAAMLYAVRAASGSQVAREEADAPAASDDYDGPSAEQVSSKLAAATAGLSQVLTATGVFEGAAYRGVRVQPGTDPELFARLGFRPGDLIMNINGAAVLDPSMLSQLKSGKILRVAVRRTSGTEVLAIDTSAFRNSAQQ